MHRSYRYFFLVWVRDPLLETKLLRGPAARIVSGLSADTHQKKGGGIGKAHVGFFCLGIAVRVFCNFIELESAWVVRMTTILTIPTAADPLDCYALTAIRGEEDTCGHL